MKYKPHKLHNFSIPIFQSILLINLITFSLDAQSLEAPSAEIDSIGNGIRFKGWTEEMFRAYEDSIIAKYYPEAILRVSDDTQSANLQKTIRTGTEDMDDYVPSLVYIDDSSVVGEIPVESGISPTGARTYNVPIMVPDGINGMTPALSLSYSSHSPNSILGPGWSLSGLSKITRGYKSIYYDGITDGIHKNTSDVFFIDGIRLINRGGDSNHIDYDSEFGQIKVRGYIYDNDLSYFEAYYPDGTYSTFGDQNRFKGQMEFPVMSRSDLFSNSIIYKYDFTPTNQHIAQIEYSDYVISFEYAKRESPISGYKAGLLYDEYSILKSIFIKNLNHQQQRIYELCYGKEGIFPLLNRIELWTEEDEHLNPILLFYGSGSNRNAWNQKKTRLSKWYSTSNPNSIQVALSRLDNKSGTDGIIVFPRMNSNFCRYRYLKDNPNELSNLYTGTEEILVYGDISGTLSLSPLSILTESGFTDILCADLTGRGEEMMIKINNNIGEKGSNLYNRITFTTYQSDPGSIMSIRHTRYFDLPVLYGLENSTDHLPMYFYAGDFNGDGRDEILAVSPHCLFGDTRFPSICCIFDVEGNTVLFQDRVMDFNVTFAGTEMPDPNEALSKSDRVIALDFNGDGKTDIAHIHGNGTDLYTFDMTDSGLKARKLNSCTTLSRSAISSYLVNAGDFNGDGLADIIATPMTSNTKSNHAEIFLSNGTGTFFSTLGGVLSKTSDNWISHDVNNDGLTDLVEYSDSKISTYICGKSGTLSAVNSLSMKNAVLVPLSPSSHNRFSTITALCDSVAINLEWMNDRSMELLLTGLVTSTGVVEKTVYAKLNDKTRYVDGIQFYQTSGDCTPPYFCLGEAIPVVASTSRHISGQEADRRDFTYTDGISHRQGLGFRGFRSIRQRDTRGNVELRTFNPLKFGIPVSLTTPIVHEEYIYTVDSDTDIIPRIKLDLKTETNLLTGDITYTEYNYDKFGNILTELTEYADGVSQMVNCQYQNKPDIGKGYRLGFLTEKATELRDDKETVLKRESIVSHDRFKPTSVQNFTNGLLLESLTFTYDSIGNLSSKTAIPYTSSTGLSESYEYDSAGHVMSEKNALGLTTEYRYDPFGLPVEIIDVRKGKTTMRYDGFGNKLSENNPDGTMKTFLSEWDSDALDGTCIITVEETGRPKMSYTRDPMKRYIRISETRFDGRHLFTGYEYNGYGKLISETLPYIEGSAPMKLTYSYDRYDRLISLKRPTSSVADEWIYQSNTVTERINGISVKRTHNPRGELVKSEDEGGIISYTLSPDGLLNRITAPGGLSTTITYDDYRRRISLDDPSAGKMTWSYDNAGNLLSQTDANGIRIEYKYNKYGQLTRETFPEYYSTIKYDKYGKPTFITTSRNSGESITYDNFGRVISQKSIYGRSFWFNKEFSYDKGNVSSITYSSNRGLLGEEKHGYTNGHLTRILFNAADTVFSLISENNFGQASRVKSGGIERNYTYTLTSLPSTRRAIDSNGNHIFSETINVSLQNGNVLTRSDNLRHTSEKFVYDNLNRLTISGKDSIVYSTGGNILRRSDVGDFDYDIPGKPYAISDVISTKSRIPVRNQYIVFTSFNRPLTIMEDDWEASFSYSPDKKRNRMLVKANGEIHSEILYLGDCYEYERKSHEDANKTTEERLYIGGNYYDAPAVYVVSDSVPEIRYILRDYLGSVRGITDSDGNMLQEMSYDAWGNLRNPDTWEAYMPGEEPELMIGRGYTGHEYLRHFGLINMNARLYDPVLGRFISPDPYVQTPDFTQNLNRFSYCLNNPMSRVDEDGEFFWFVVAGVAFVTGVTNVAIHWKEIKAAGGGWNSFAKGATYFGVGALAGGVGAAAGMAVMPALSANIASALTITSEQFVAVSMGFVPGATIGAVSGASEGFLLNSGNALVEGQNFGEALSLGAVGFLEGGISSAILGGISGANSAYMAGENIWTGNPSKVPLSESLLQTDAPSFFQGVADNNHKYYGYYGYEQKDVRYVGITGRDPEIRFNEHLRSKSPRASLNFMPQNNFQTKLDARIWEQTKIMKYKMIKDGGQLYNKRNEISPRLWEKYGIKF